MPEFSERFIKFCQQEGISLEYPDDYGPWLACYKAGCIEGHRLGVEDGYRLANKHTIKINSKP